MKGRIWTLLIGLALGIAVAVPLTAWASSHDQGETDDTHSQMHAMVDAMMGDGASEHIHEEMPGSEEMMELCSQHMDGHDEHLDMMNGMHGMMKNGGMMNLVRGMTNHR